MQKTIIQSIREVATLELRTIFSNNSVVLILIFAPIIYATIYSAAYAKQVATKIPIAIVDNSQSIESRALIEMLSAAENLQVAYSTTDRTEAENLLYRRKVYGIIYIPLNYQTARLRAEQASVALYCDASYFLMYRQVYQGVMSVISMINSRHNSGTVTLRAHTMFNSELGYGTFIMPAILIVILQQTAIIAICAMGGIWRRRKLYAQREAVAIVAGKAVVYCVICATIACYILGIHYRIFGYPQNGTIGTAAAVMVPYILSFTMLGITISTLFRRAESAILTLMWTSIPILLLSGASLPAEAMPRALYLLGKLSPSSSAVSAYIRVQSMGATLQEVSGEVIVLWALTALYTATAVVAIKKVSARDHYLTRTLD